MLVLVFILFSVLVGMSPAWAAELSYTYQTLDLLDPQETRSPLSPVGVTNDDHLLLRGRRFDYLAGPDRTLQALTCLPGLPSVRPGAAHNGLQWLALNNAHTIAGNGDFVGGAVGVILPPSGPCML